MKPNSCERCNYPEYYLYNTGEDYNCLQCQPSDNNPWYKNVIIDKEDIWIKFLYELMEYGHRANTM